MSEEHTRLPEVVIINRLMSGQIHFESISCELSLHKVQLVLEVSHSMQVESHTWQVLLVES